MIKFKLYVYFAYYLIDYKPIKLKYYNIIKSFLEKHVLLCEYLFTGNRYDGVLFFTITLAFWIAGLVLSFAALHHCKTNSKILLI
jgi:hypothetical protein